MLGGYANGGYVPGTGVGGRRVLTCLAFVVMVMFVGRVDAVQVRAFELVRAGETYRLHSDITLDADPSRVRSVLGRYEHIPELDPDITEVTMLGVNDDGSVRMRLATYQCVAIVCAHYRWTQDVLTLPSGDVVAEVVAGRGDIRAGRVRYRAVPHGDGARLVVDADIDVSGLPLPASLLAPWMHASLRDEALETARLVERAANALPDPLRAPHTSSSPSF